MTDASAELAQELLSGADQIAAFTYGNAKERRKIYHLAETTDFPVFKMGGVLCARRSKILSWIEAQEQKRLKK